MVYIEILIICVILLYAWNGFRRGFLSQFYELAGMVISFIIALRFYNYTSLVLEKWGVNPPLARPLGFFILWILLQILFYLLYVLIFRYLFKNFQSTRINQFLGIFGGAARGVVTVAILLMVFFVTPFASTTKDGLIQHPVSGWFIKTTARFENQLEKVLGEVNTLTFQSPVTADEETTVLNFKVIDFKIDEGSERAMLVLLNQDRAKAGLKPLEIDESIREVARAHSIDMAQNGYFSHINLSGKTPADRMLAGKVDFWLAGENLALAPTYELAEIGFMNSPKHRDNILEPKFGRIGIGIIDLGIYGRMTTQNFAD